MLNFYDTSILHKEIGEICMIEFQYDEIRACDEKENEKKRLA